MGWGALIGLGMASASTAANVWGQQQANETSIELAEENRAWQEYMASTRYQRTMADMRAAGLNPILAYKQGGGPVPSGNVANVGNIMDKVGENTQRAASTAMAYRKNTQEVKSMKASEGQAASQDRLNRMQEQHVAKQLEIKNLEVASARAEHAKAQHEEAFWNTNTGRVVAESGAIEKAFPGKGPDTIAKYGLVTAHNLNRKLEIQSSPYSARSAQIAKGRKPGKSRSYFKKGGNWRKYYSPTKRP